MTSRLQIVNAIRTRVANHLYVNKLPYVDPNDPIGQPSSKAQRYHYAWKPDRTEAHRIKRLSKGYAGPSLNPTDQPHPS